MKKLISILLVAALAILPALGQVSSGGNAVRNAPNIIPSGQVYNADFAWTNTVIPGARYYYDGADEFGAANGPDIATDPSAIGYFTAITNKIALAGNSGTPVVGKVYGPLTNVYGNFKGSFDGTVSATSFVPDGALSNNIVRRNEQLFINNSGDATPGIPILGGNHLIMTKNTLNKSTLALLYGDNAGFADIRFLDWQGNEHAALGIPSLGTSTTNSSLSWPEGFYIESYGGRYPLWFRGSGNTWGGFLGSDNGGTEGAFFVSFRNSVTAVTPCFFVNPTNGNTTVYGTNFANYGSISNTLTTATLTVSGSGGITLATNSTAPANTTTIRAWVSVTNSNGGVFKMPLYQ